MALADAPCMTSQLEGRWDDLGASTGERRAARRTKIATTSAMNWQRQDEVGEDFADEIESVHEPSTHTKMSEGDTAVLHQHRH